MDQFTEITRKSFGGRIVDSIKGVFLGIILFLGSFALIGWNEYQSVERIRTLDEGRGLVIETDPDPIAADARGRLIHLTGQATTNARLTDPAFGINENAIHLSRIVEMYQWHESEETKTERKIGGAEVTTTTYTYSKDWSRERIDSMAFRRPDGHQNPPMPLQGGTVTASTVTLGAYVLTDAVVARITKADKITPTAETAAMATQALRRPYGAWGDYVITGEPNNPVVGDIRISFEAVRPQIVSVIGQEDRGMIRPYAARHGELLLVQPGRVSIDEMFAQAEAENRIRTWIFRLVGLAAMWIGLFLFLAPISVLSSVVPFLGRLAEAGLVVITGAIALLLGTATIAISWFAVRPILSLMAIALGAVLAWIVARLGLRRNAHRKMAPRNAAPAQR